MRKILSIWFFVLSFILLFATNFNFTVFMICYFLITAVAHFCLSCNPEDIMGTPPMVRSSWFGLYTLASFGLSVLVPGPWGQKPGEPAVSGLFRQAEGPGAPVSPLP